MSANTNPSPHPSDIRQDLPGSLGPCVSMSSLFQLMDTHGPSDPVSLLSTLKRGSKFVSTSTDKFVANISHDPVSHSTASLSHGTQPSWDSPTGAPGPTPRASTPAGGMTRLSRRRSGVELVESFSQSFRSPRFPMLTVTPTPVSWIKYLFEADVSSP